MKTILICFGMVLSLSACSGSSGGGGGSSPGSTVSGTAAMVMGPSTTPGLEILAKRRSRPMNSGDYWALTPDSATVSFLSIQFLMSDGSNVSSTLTNCTGTYATSNASGASLFTCPVAVPIGTINAIGVNTSASASITIADSTNNIYTTPGTTTGITIGTPSPSGQGATTVNIPNSGNGDPTQYPITEYLTSPLVVTAQSTPSVYIIVDMIHTLLAQDNGSGGLAVQTGTLKPPVRVFASFSAGATAEYYTTTASAGNVDMGGDNSDTYVTVDYTGSGQANHIWTIPCTDGNNPSEAWSVSPANSPTAQNGDSAGGFLGLDTSLNGPSGTLSFALPVGFTWAVYRIYGQMERQTTLGQSSTMNCRRNDAGLTPPPPTDGNSYASGGDVLVGAADLGVYTVESQAGLVLVAN